MKPRLRIELEELDSRTSRTRYRAWILNGSERIPVKTDWSIYPEHIRTDARLQIWKMRLSRWTGRS